MKFSYNNIISFTPPIKRLQVWKFTKTRNHSLTSLFYYENYKLSTLRVLITFPFPFLLNQWKFSQTGKRECDIIVLISGWTGCCWVFLLLCQLMEQNYIKEVTISSIVRWRVMAHGVRSPSIPLPGFSSFLDLLLVPSGYPLFSSCRITQVKPRHQVYE